MITHVVLLSLLDQADREEFAARLRALPADIEAIRSLSVGLDLGADPTADDLVLITTHDDEAGRTTYLEHPVHQQFLVWASPRLVARHAVDFQS